MSKRRRGGRVPGTYTAPHNAAAPPRCAQCDAYVHELETAPQRFPIEKLRELREAVATAAPPYGEMVRAKTEVGVEVWACPRHVSLERRIGRDPATGKQTSEWWIVARQEDDAA